MRKLDAVLLAVITMGMTGCGSMIEKVSRLENSGILNPDSVQGDRTRSKDILKKAHPSEQGAIALRGGRSIEAFKEQNLSTYPDSACERGTFFCEQYLSQQNPGNSSQARTYIEAGLTLSNELCQAWFTRLGVAQATLRQSSDTISATGSLSAAILAFSEAPSKVAGLTASTFGVGKQLTDALNANYIVSVDLTAVSAAVRDYRATYAQQVGASTEPWTYYSARRVIMAYDDTCSSLSVRRFVNRRVEGDTKGPVAEPLLEATIDTFAREAKTLFGREVTRDDLGDIYAYLFIADAPESLRTRIRDTLTERGLMAGDKVKFAKEGSRQFDEGDFLGRLIRSNIDGYVRNIATDRLNQRRTAPAVVAGTTPSLAPNTETQATTSTPSGEGGRPLDAPPKP